MSLPNAEETRVPIPASVQLPDGEVLAAKAREVLARLSLGPVEVSSYIDDFDEERPLTVVKLVFDLVPLEAAAAYRSFVGEWVREVPLWVLRTSSVKFTGVEKPKTREAA